jgi:hypothetical protein
MMKEALYVVQNLTVGLQQYGKLVQKGLERILTLDHMSSHSFSLNTNQEMPYP